MIWSYNFVYFLNKCHPSIIIPVPFYDIYRTITNIIYNITKIIGNKRQKIKIKNINILLNRTPVIH